MMNHTMIMNMYMVMSFKDWDDYEGEILFRTWNPSNRGQFAASWFAIFLSTIFWHFLNSELAKIKREMYSSKRSNSGSSLEKGDLGLTNNMSSGLINNAIDINTGTMLILRIKHAVLNGFTYGWALLLMLVAMTYNPSLFLALIFGYMFGDFFFGYNTCKLNGMKTTDCH